MMSIEKETPLSITTTNNPIFEVLKNTTGIVKNDSGYEMVELKAGSKLRLLGCKMSNPSSPYRWGENQVIWLDNSLTAYIGGGELGEKFDGHYDGV